MNRQTRFHILAITTISAIIALVYFSTRTTEAEVEAEKFAGTPPDHYVRIVNASWGLNCNDAIVEKRKKLETEGLAKDKNGNILPNQLMRAIEPDNVLKQVGILCDKKIICEVNADSETLGIEPYADCFKQLDVTYRCFNLDKLNRASVGSNEPLVMNCSARPKAANAPATAQ